jgi:NTE family protein
MYSPRLALIGLILLCCSSLQTHAQSRERIGLVLAGGGARGIAHAGVIRALEEMHVPVDVIAGTSMGALVGGLYATGMNASDLEEIIFQMDWEKAFEDKVVRGELPLRRKADDYDYPTAVNLSFTEGRLSIPLGLVQGQQVRHMIKELMQDAIEVQDFNNLPTPYRAVATDIETGDAYVFAGGSIVTAMRASMSLPGLLEPVEHDGKLLVDGGLANNIPVDVARSMGVDRLIVIDIGTPLKRRDEISSLISVADQVLGFLTRKNSLAQLDTLAETDVLIRPDLESMGMLDFDRQEAIYERGYVAALSHREELQALRIDDQAWSQHLNTRKIPDSADPIIDYIAVQNNSRVSDELIRVRVSQSEGEVLDRPRLLQDIATIYALDYWEIIDYELQRDANGVGLLIKADARNYGEDRLKLGISLVTDLDGASEFGVGASYLLKGLNARGGEFYSRAQLGHTVLVSAEFYQPLDLQSRFFLAPHFRYEDREAYSFGPEYDIEEIIGKWRVRESRAEVAGGVNLFNNAQVRAGLFRSYGSYRDGVSNNEGLIEDKFHKGGTFFNFRYDTLDQAYFPTRGSLLYADYELHRQGMGSDSDFERWQALGQTAFTFGKDARNTLLFTARTGQSIGAPNEPQNYYQLGGLFSLSGLHQDIYSGRQMAFGMLQYQRRLSKNSVIPLDMPIHVGVSIEGGQVWSKRSEIDVGDFISAGSIYLAIDSPVGPLYFAYGRSEHSTDALYLSLGWPFLTNNSSLGR